MSKSKELIVAAIDFGTTYSGCAYSTRDDYENDRTKVFAVTSCSNGGTLLTQKTPTVVLFEPTGNFHSFGYDAESKYAELADEDKHEGWRYFKRFKMQLFNGRRREINTRLKLRDDQGKQMLAVDVFAAAIGYLKNDFLKTIQQRILHVEETDIRWVLTVPAIWEDAAKQFMTEAAIKAGVPASQLVLAYEPEAAALYCKESKLLKSQGESGDVYLTKFGPGFKFMVIDMGGGTVDYSSHEVQRNGSLAALSSPSGGPWGGTLVDKNIVEFLNAIFTEEVIKTFSKDFIPEKLELERKIEAKKRQSVSENIVIPLPNQLFSSYKELNPASEFEISLAESQFGDSVTRMRDRLIIKKDLFIGMFDESRQEIIRHSKNLLCKSSLRDLKTLLLVGGFSESEIIQGAIKKGFPAFDVIMPEDGEVAIVKGAVMYGHNLDDICLRKMPFTYGISTAVPFEEGVHPIAHRTKGCDNTYKCEDIFKPFVIKDQAVMPRITEWKESFTAQSVGATQVTVEVYKTDKEPAPMLTTDCVRVAELDLDLSPVDRTKKAVVDVTIQLGGTTMAVTAQERDTGTPVKTEFHFLQ